MENNELDWSNSALKPGIFTGAGYDENGRPIVVKIADACNDPNLVLRNNGKEFPEGKPEIIKI